MPETSEPTDGSAPLTWGQLWPLIVFLTMVAALLAAGTVVLVLRR